MARKLRDTAHMTQEQAEGIADALAEAMSGAELATKGDIATIQGDIKEAEGRLETKIIEVKADLLKTIIGAVAINSAVVIGGMSGLAKLLGH